ncbi:hypothetical protein OQA88_9671 [Cercophora sp. LCS_1]
MNQNISRPSRSSRSSMRGHGHVPKPSRNGPKKNSGIPKDLQSATGELVCFLSYNPRPQDMGLKLDGVPRKVVVRFLREIVKALYKKDVQSKRETTNLISKMSNCSRTHRVRLAKFMLILANDGIGKDDEYLRGVWKICADFMDKLWTVELKERKLLLEAAAAAAAAGGGGGGGGNSDPSATKDAPPHQEPAQSQNEQSESRRMTPDAESTSSPCEKPGPMADKGDGDSSDEWSRVASSEEAASVGSWGGLERELDEFEDESSEDDEDGGAPLWVMIP